jgi:hypothetical protein
LQLGSILNTFRNLIERSQVYRLSIRKEVPRLLHNTHGLEGFDILNSINKEANYEQEYMHGLFIQCLDDAARSMLARFG